MASFTASASTVSVARPALLLKPTVAVSAPVLGKVLSLVSSSILDLTLIILETQSGHMQSEDLLVCFICSLCGSSLVVWWRVNMISRKPF